jgi:hypothetical protein
MKYLLAVAMVVLASTVVSAQQLPQAYVGNWCKAFDDNESQIPFKRGLCTDRPNEHFEVDIIQVVTPSLVVVHAKTSDEEICRIEDRRVTIREAQKQDMDIGKETWAIICKPSPAALGMFAPSARPPSTERTHWLMLSNKKLHFAVDAKE